MHERERDREMDRERERERERERHGAWAESSTERSGLKNHNGDFSGPENFPFELKVFECVSGFTPCPQHRGSFGFMGPVVLLGT